MKRIKSQEWVLEHLHDPRVRLIDCRFWLMQPEAGIAGYEEAHIPGAIYMDLDRDLSAPKQKHGGRHPLPDVEIFSQKLGAAGIDNETIVVAYDEQNGMVASRLWWLLEYLGHPIVYVMDGTFTNWQEKGYPVAEGVSLEKERSSTPPRTFVPHPKSHMVVSMEEVLPRVADGAILIDSREPVRYLGEQEPIDPVAGHIPGAINEFWKNTIGDTGSWKTSDEQRERFEQRFAAEGIKANPDQEIIVYCGSGVSACPNVMSLIEAGYTQVKLYTGSWSDWCSYQDNPVAKGNN